MTRNQLRQVQIKTTTARMAYSSRKIIISQIKSRVLKENVYMESEEWDHKERIVKPFNDYLMNKADYADYRAKVYALILQAGITDLPDSDTVEDHKQFIALKKAEDELYDAFIQITPARLADILKKAKEHDCPEMRQQGIDIMLRLDTTTIPTETFKCE